MKLFTSIITTALLLCGVANASTVELVVDFKDNASMEQIHEAEQLTGLHFEENSAMWEADKVMTVKVDDSRAAKYIELLKGDSDVEVAELNQIYSIPENELGGYGEEEFGQGVRGGVGFDVPNDKAYEKQRWHFNMIGLESAWKNSDGAGVVVAVLDTGVSDGRDKNFPRVGDLVDTEILKGFNFIDNNDRPNDGNAHGTHVASSIAESTNNSIGGVGIAFKAKILPVKVLSDSGSGSTAGIAEAIRWASDHGANIINMSLGGGGYSEVMANALKYAVSKNVLVFCAAGNSGMAKIEYPAAMDGCLAISSVGPKGELAPYSSHGTNGNGVFLASPGGDTRGFGEAGGVWQSTIARDASGRTDPMKWSMQGFQGTSMATPIAAGSAALVVSKLMEDNGKFDRKDVIKILTETATPKNDKAKYGAGIVNAGAAVEQAQSSSHSHKGRWALGILAIIGLGVFRLNRRK